MTPSLLISNAYKNNKAKYPGNAIETGTLTPRKAYVLFITQQHKKDVYGVDIATYYPTRDKYTLTTQLFSHKGLAEWYIERIKIEETVIRFLRINKKGRVL